MLERIGTGPVFKYEWLITSRRWQVYAARSLLVALLLTGLAVVWWSEVANRGLTTFRDLATVGGTFYQAIAGIQLTLILAVGPAAMAGAICVDKSRGTLAHLFVTDLSDVEIVLGKLAPRLIMLVGFLGCTLPVMALGTLLGGIDPKALVGAFLVALGVALLGSSLALAFSVWASRAYEALFATYAVLAIWLLARPTVAYVFRMRWLNWPVFLDPIGLTFEPSFGRKDVLVEQVSFLLLAMFGSVLLTLIAVRRVRSVANRQAGRGRDGRPARRRARPSPSGRLWPASLRWPSPSLDGNPVLWREWHRNRPSSWIVLFSRLYIVIVAAFSVGTMGVVLLDKSGVGELPPWVNALQTAIGFLFLAVVTSTTLAEERDRGSLDVLLATPLTTRSILVGKWWGSYRLVPWLAVGPALVALSLTWLAPDRGLMVLLLIGLILAYGAALTSLGLALATWIARLNRVLVAVITVHLLITVGWFFLMVTVQSRTEAEGPALASTFFGPGMLTALMSQSHPNNGSWANCVMWAQLWIVIDLTVALILFLATLATFDRCMGRVPETAGQCSPNAKTTVKYEHFSTVAE